MQQQARAQEAQPGTAPTPPAAQDWPRWIVLLKQEPDPSDISKNTRLKLVEINAPTSEAAVKGCEDLPGALVDVQPATPEGRHAITRHLPNAPQ